MKPLFTTMLTLLCAVGANAGIITASLVDMGQQGLGTRTYDVVVTVTDYLGVPDDWTACAMTATLTGCCAFVDESSYNPPGWEPFIPVYFWDSFFTAPDYFPNTGWGSNLGGISFADPDAVIESPQLRFGEWYDTSDTGSGEFVMHRLTVLCDDDCTEQCWLNIHFETAAQNTGGQLFPYDWNVMVCIPEPSSLVFLALAGLVLLRGR